MWSEDNEIKDATVAIAKDKGIRYGHCYLLKIVESEIVASLSADDNGIRYRT